MEGMTPQEKAIVMQFMGQTYGQLHQQDQNIIGSAGNLKPKSAEMKQVFEQTAHSPTIHPQRPPQPPPQQQAPQAPVQQITPEQAAMELQQAPPEVIEVEPPVAPAAVDNQGEFDFSEPTVTDKLLDLLEEQNLLLKEISLKLDNGKKTTKSRKQS
tara:strand:+ start:771 stop:1238 length:468 start_codon:yes stop_codon:yes gene_type:complete